MSYATYGNRVVLSQTLFTVSDDVLKSIGPRAERRVQDALFHLAQETRGKMREDVPVKSGALKASIYVTRGAGVQGAAGTPYTRQSTVAYFRAANAAIRRNNRLEFQEVDLVHTSSQRPRHGSNFKAVMDTIGGIKLKTYAPGETSKGMHDDVTVTDYIMPSVMEAGAAGRKSFFVTIGASAYYAGYVEFGHGGSVFGWVAPQPFFRPAMAWAKSRLNGVIAKAIKESAVGGV